jgi:AhpD family alkylhydroperoxidase
MGERLDAYRRLGERPNRFKESGNPVFERFAELYPVPYEGGALSTTTKELAALAISIVRDCEDCITYHLMRLRELGATRDQLYELFALTLVVGGSTTIPTLRRSAAFIDELEEDAASKASKHS